MNGLWLIGACIDTVMYICLGSCNNGVDEVGEATKVFPLVIYHYACVPFIPSFMVADAFDTRRIVLIHTTVIRILSAGNKHKTIGVIIRRVTVRVIYLHIHRRSFIVAEGVDYAVIIIPIPVNPGLPITTVILGTSQFIFQCPWVTSNLISQITFLINIKQST